MKSKRVGWLVVGLAVLIAAWAWRPWEEGERRAGVAPRVPEAAAAVSGGADVLRFAAGAAQLLMIEARPVEASPVPLADVLSGRLAYDEDVTARPGVNVAGRIVALKAAPGDRVEAGQVLAEIDSPDFGSAQAEWQKARADERLKRLAVQRGKALGVGEAIAARDQEVAEAEYAAARAETARAEQRLQGLNPHGLPVRGQRVSLTSPISGVVTERAAALAQEVGPGMAEPLFVITRPQRLWVMIDLPEKLIATVRPGVKVRVESDAYPGESFTAVIAQRGQVMDRDSRRALARAVLEEPDARLLPEMFVRASLLQDTGRGVRLPNTALVHRGIHVYAFVETAPGEFHRRRVELLNSGSDFSYVGGGLEDGERVVLRGALLLDAEMSARFEEHRENQAGGGQ